MHKKRGQKIPTIYIPETVFFVCLFWSAGDRKQGLALGALSLELNPQPQEQISRKQKPGTTQEQIDALPGGDRMNEEGLWNAKPTRTV